jgi:hypothetical protein
MDALIEDLEKVKLLFLKNREDMENFNHGNHLGWIHYQQSELEKINEKIKEIETQIIIRNFVLNNE